MSIFSKALNKAKQVYNAVKKVVPQPVKNVIKSTPQYKAANAAVTVAKKASSYVAPKTPAKTTSSSSKSTSSSRKSTSSSSKNTSSSSKSSSSKTTSKPTSFVDQLKQGLSDIGQTKVYASSSSPSSTPKSSLVSNPNNAAMVNTGSVKDLFGNLLRSLGMTQDYGVSELLGGDTTSLNSVTQPNAIQKISVPLAKAVNPITNQVPSVYGMTTTAADTGADKVVNYAQDYLQTHTDPRTPTQMYSPTQPIGSTTPSSTPAPNYSIPGGEGTLDPSGQWVQDAQGIWQPNEQIEIPQARVDNSTPDSVEQFADLTGDQGLFALLDDSEAWKLNEEQVLNSQNAVAEADALNKRRLEAQYQAIMNKYDSLPPQYREAADKALSNIKDALDLTYDKGAQSLKQIDNAYDDTESSAIKTKKMQDMARRNMFSSLGTAESSAFIEGQQQADSSFGTDLNRTELERKDKKFGVQKDLGKMTDWATKEKQRIIQERDQNILEVEKNKAISGEDKAIALKEIALDTMNRLADIDYNRNMFNTGLATNKNNTLLSLLSAAIPGIQQQQLYQQFGGDAVQTGEAPNYSPTAGNGSMSQDGQWVYNNGKWNPVNQPVGSSGYYQPEGGYAALLKSLYNNIGM